MQTEGISVINLRWNQGLSSLITAVVVGMLVFPAGAAGQRTQAQERLLVLPLIPQDRAGDSAFVVDLATEVRDRLGGRARNRVQVISNDRYCEALAASGFPCGFLPDENAAEQLAQFLRADAYVTGYLSRNSRAPSAQVRMVDVGRSGIAGWFDAVGEPDDDADDFSRVVSDSLRNQIGVADNARDCSERRDRSDFRGARDRAGRVLEEYPNHPSAAQCIAYVFEATEQPIDSLIWAYSKIVQGDSMQGRSWDRLARLHLQNGDTLEAVRAFDRQLRSDPTDQELRLNVGRMWVDRGEFEMAVMRADEGLESSPEDMTLLQLKARACLEGEMWTCTMETLARQLEVDPSKNSDSLFFIQLVGAADLSADTAAYLHWTEQALQQFPNSLRFWGQMAALRSARGETAEAVRAYQEISRIDPNNTLAQLGWARAILDGLVIDTAVPLDTASFKTADSLLTMVAGRSSGDPNTLRNIAVFYFNPGQQLVRAQMRPDIAIEWLDKSIQYDVTGTLTQQAGFFYGIAAVLHLSNFFNVVRDSGECARVDEYERFVTLGTQRMQDGASVAPETANSILRNLGQFADPIPTFRAAFCSN